MSAGNPTERPEPDDLEIVWQLADECPNCGVRITPPPKIEMLTCPLCGERLRRRAEKAKETR